jgi:RES domain-containing protein
LSAFAGLVWRHVPVGAVALHVGKLFKHSEGRWNRKGEFACLYTALTRVGALAELAKARATTGSIAGTRDLVSIQIGRLEPVLDLTEASVYRATALAAGEQPDASLMTTNGDAAYEHCRRLSEAARAGGCTALIVPSAAQPGEKNLVIYFDVVVPKQVDIDDGPDRETIAFTS